MASDDIWILGIKMTKFGKHPDKDTVDLAAEAAMAALADGGVTMRDIGVLAAGCLMEANSGHRSASAEADRPDRDPRLQRGQRVRHRARPRCARRSWRSRPASATWGSRSGSRSWPAPACSVAAARRSPTARRGPRRVGSARSRPPTAGSAPTRCPARSPRSAWSTATSTAVPRSSCSPGSARRTTRTRRSTRSPPTASASRSTRS